MTTKKTKTKASDAIKATATPTKEAEWIPSQETELIAAAVAMSKASAKVPPQPVRKPPPEKAKKWSEPWWSARTLYETENWRAQREWWQQHNHTSLLLLLDSRQGLIEACSLCWMHAVHHGVTNAHELRRAMLALERVDMPSDQLERQLAEAALAIDALELKAWLQGQPERAELAAEERAFDVVRDPMCVKIRKALAVEPLTLGRLVARCGGEQHRTTIKDRLRRLQKAGHVHQVKKRYAYALTDTGRTHNK